MTLSVGLIYPRILLYLSALLPNAFSLNEGGHGLVSTFITRSKNLKSEDNFTDSILRAATELLLLISPVPYTISYAKR